MNKLAVLACASIFGFTLIVGFLFGQVLEVSPGLALVSNKEGVFLTYTTESSQEKEDGTTTTCCDENGHNYSYNPGNNYSSVIVYKQLFTGKIRRLVSVESSEITDNTYLYRFDVYENPKNYNSKSEKGLVDGLLADYKRLSK